MKRKISIMVAFLLTFSMAAGTLASCSEDLPSTVESEEQSLTQSQNPSDDKEQEKDTTPNDSKSEVTTSTQTDSEGSKTEDSKDEDSKTETEKPEDSEKEESNSGTTKPEDSEKEESNSGTTKPEDSEKEESNDGTTKPEDSEPEDEYEIDNEALIQYANSIKNGVNYYYPNANRASAVLENLEMSLEYGLLESGNKQVIALTNKSGAAYVQNTMDVFVRMSDGSTYYASTSKTDTTSNLFRLGYYFYEARFEGQDFFNSAKVDASKKIKLSDGLKSVNDTVLASNDENGMTIKLQNDGKNSFDPYVILQDGAHSTTKGAGFTLMEITMKADSNISAGQVYVNTGSGFNGEQRYKFALIADGNYHTYTIPLFSIKDYKGKITGIRFDVDGTDGATYTFKEMKLHVADVSNFPSGLSIARSFNAYSDKLHHVIQVSAQSETTGIKAVGMLTKIDANTVAKILVKDKNGTHDTINGVDWATVEYIGFDIKNAGIFGYILPADNKSGTLYVTLENGVYVIEQTCTPANGTIIPSKGEFNEELGYAPSVPANNGNDFYMGQRIYTDDNHDFAEFIYEAECERNPLGKTLFRIAMGSSDKTAFVGYDALRGIYVLSYDQTVSNGPNDYPTINFTVKSTDYDRKIYVMAYSDSTTVIETSVLLNDRKLMLPVPIEVGKNFSEKSGERNLYNLDDPVYSESIFPLVLPKGETLRYSVVNAYFKWGRFPLKQVSWIQFYAPYYHLSTAMTETNCITPYYTTRTSRNLNTLPDFRAMSAPPFSGSQRNSGGTHHFLKYTDADGNFVTSENTKNTVGSHGPTYADVTMDYLSDDGKIKITYNHMEMPQEDENRTYYEMSYEILEDVSFNDFAKDFSFYSVRPNDPTGVYTLVGYLDKNNEGQVVNAKMAGDEAVYYTLGKDAPYFSYMKMTEDRSNKTGYVNLAFLVHSSSFLRDGEEVDHNFVLADLGGTLSISLDFGEYTLKKGDKITINAILLPWGSQETVYDWSNGKAPDQNVRDVRQNSIKNPLRVVADNDCEVIDTVYVPMLRTTNGESAEFTVTGGQDNSAIRIYGFKMLTAPKVYELIDGEWTPYRLSSGYYSYNQDVVRLYDGYCVYYDEDGTFSYSFIVDKENNVDRKFKIVANSEFGNWIELDKTDIISNFLHKESEYNASTNAFVFHVDYINGVSHNYNSSSTSGAAEVSFIEQTMTDAKLIFSGWTMVESGVSKYLWSIDGKDWYECTFLKSSSAGTCGNTIIEAANGIKTGYTFSEADAAKGAFSANNALVVDLSAYAGQTVDVRIAAIPQNKTEEICMFTMITDVTVPSGSGGEVTPPSVDTEVTEPEVTEPEVTEPETTEPETTKPETTEPETTVPEVTEPEVTEPIGFEMNLEVSGEALYNFTQTPQGAVTGISSIQYMDGYTRFTNTNGVEGHFNVFTGNKNETGKYLVIKYRLPSSNTSKVATFRFNISTTQNGIAATNNFYSSATLISDNNWHVLVIDMEKYEEERASTNEFLPSEEDGKYYANFLKLFIFSDTKYAENTCIDIEYVAMCNSFGTVKNCNKDMTSLQLSTSNSATAPYSNVTNDCRYLDPTSNYTLADKYFCFHVDKINGNLADANGNKYSYNSISNKGITEKNLNETLSGTTLSVGGWCPIEGGASKYLWSVDGQNWYDCGGNPSQSGSGILSAASGMMSGAYTFTEADGVKGQYAITIDLSAYAGQTVDVRIAAAPVGSSDTLCVLTSINGVTVSSNN